MEKFDAELALKRLNVLSECRLCDAKTLGYLTEVQFLGRNGHVF